MGKFWYQKKSKKFIHDYLFLLMISSWTNLKKALLCFLEFKIISTHFFWDKMAHYAACIGSWLPRLIYRWKLTPQIKLCMESNFKPLRHQGPKQVTNLVVLCCLAGSLANTFISCISMTSNPLCLQSLWCPL